MNYFYIWNKVRDTNDNQKTSLYFELKSILSSLEVKEDYPYDDYSEGLEPEDKK